MCLCICIFKIVYFLNYSLPQTSESPNSAVSREASTQSSAAATSQGYVLPEGKIMPNTVFVGGIDVRVLYSYFVCILKYIVKPGSVWVRRGGSSA